MKETIKKLLGSLEKKQGGEQRFAKVADPLNEGDIAEDFGASGGVALAIWNLAEGSGRPELASDSGGVENISERYL